MLSTNLHVKFAHYEAKLCTGRSTILCLYVPEFQRQVLIFVPNKWIPQTKFQWIPHRNTFNVNFVGTFVLLRIPQQANITSCSGFRNCKWIPQNVSGIRKYKFIPQTVSGFQIFVQYSTCI